MYNLHIHKDAEKALKKAQKRIRQNAFDCIVHLRDNDMIGSPFSIAPLHGNFQKFKYYEAKIDKDYRIIFRTAGTHNALWTG